jgi:hypothetical protein
MTRHLIGGLAVLALVIGAVGCASAPSPAVPATPAAASSTVSPTSTPLTSTVSVTGRHPRDGTKVGILVYTVPGARISVVAHFQTGDWKQSARADANGLHTFWYQIGSATPGYQVKVDVRVSAHGQKLSSRAAFTPRQRPPPPAPKPVPAPTAAPPPATTAPPPPASCYPRASTGNCYEPGEFCSHADAGMSGVAGDGKAIICETTTACVGNRPDPRPPKGGSKNEGGLATSAPQPSLGRQFVGLPGGQYAGHCLPFLRSRSRACSLRMDSTVWCTAFEPGRCRRTGAQRLTRAQVPGIWRSGVRSVRKYSVNLPRWLNGAGPDRLLAGTGTPAERAVPASR